RRVPERVRDRRAVVERQCGNDGPADLGHDAAHLRDGSALERREARDGRLVVRWGEPQHHRVRRGRGLLGLAPEGVPFQLALDVTAPLDGNELRQACVRHRTASFRPAWLAAGSTRCRVGRGAPGRYGGTAYLSRRRYRDT